MGQWFPVGHHFGIVLDCGGKRSATPLWLILMTANTGKIESEGGLTQSEAKGPSPRGTNLPRSAGAFHKIPWPHAPLHQLALKGTYFVMAVACQWLTLTLSLRGYAFFFSTSPIVRFSTEIHHRNYEYILIDHLIYDPIWKTLRQTSPGIS